MKMDVLNFKRFLSVTAPVMLLVIVMCHATFDDGRNVITFEPFIYYPEHRYIACFFT